MPPLLDLNGNYSIDTNRYNQWAPRTAPRCYLHLLNHENLRTCTWIATDLDIRCLQSLSLPLVTQRHISTTFSTANARAQLHKDTRPGNTTGDAIDRMERVQAWSVCWLRRKASVKTCMLTDAGSIYHDSSLKRRPDGYANGLNVLSLTVSPTST